MHSRFDELPFKTAAEWHSVLVAADRFQFRECGIRKLAIEQLVETASCVEKIVWGTKCEIKSLLIHGYGEACNREDPLTAQEVEELTRSQPLAVELIARKREAILDALGRCEHCPRSRAQVLGDELGIHTQVPNSQPTKLPTPLFVISDTQSSDKALRRVKRLPARYRSIANPPSPSRPPRPAFSFDDGFVTFAVSAFCHCCV